MKWFGPGLHLHARLSEKDRREEMATSTTLLKLRNSSQLPIGYSSAQSCAGMDDNRDNVRILRISSLQAYIDELVKDSHGQGRVYKGKGKGPMGAADQRFYIESKRQLEEWRHIATWFNRRRPLDITYTMRDLNLNIPPQYLEVGPCPMDPNGFSLRARRARRVLPPSQISQIRRAPATEEPCCYVPPDEDDDLFGEEYEQEIDFDTHTGLPFVNVIGCVAGPSRLSQMSEEDLKEEEQQQKEEQLQQEEPFIVPVFLVADNHRACGLSRLSRAPKMCPLTPVPPQQSPLRLDACGRADAACGSGLQLPPRSSRVEVS